MKNVKALIFDLDHCLYQDPEDKNGLYFEGAVKAALRLGIFEDFEAAAQAVAQSVADHRSEIEGLVRHHGAHHPSIYRAYHEESLPQFLAQAQPIAGFAQRLGQVVEAYGLKLGVLTHSPREWAEPFLHHLELAAHIPPDRVFALNDPAIDFKMKTTKEPFEHVCGALDILPEEAVMMDDLEKNLIMPSAMGMTTVRICWDEATLAKEKPAHVSYKALHPKQFLDQFFPDLG